MRFYNIVVLKTGRAGGRGGSFLALLFTLCCLCNSLAFVCGGLGVGGVKVGGKAEDCGLELGPVVGRVHGFLEGNLEENAGGSSGVCVGVFYYLFLLGYHNSCKGTAISEGLYWMLGWGFFFFLRGMRVCVLWRQKREESAHARRARVARR